MADVTLRGLNKTYDGRVNIIRGIDLDILDGEFMVFVGPSGCGKSTTLRMIAGLEDISGGELSIGGEVVNDRPAAGRGVAMVFQSYALYPHMTVAENMGFALKLAGVRREEAQAAVARAARILQLEDLLDRKPKALSGGQRQRVAIGRAIVRDPKVFLFDEPLSNLDAALRVQMRSELAQLHQQLGTTMIYVTHDQVEAMTLGQRIAVFNAGTIEQCGTPQVLYERPATVFVAGFMGSPNMNLLPASVLGSSGAGGGPQLQLADGFHWTLPGADRFESPDTGTTVTLGFRPEQAQLVAPGQGDLAARVDRAEYLGNEQIVHLSLIGATSKAPSVRVVGPVDTGLATPGQPMDLRLDPARLHLFGADGRSLLKP